MESSIFKQAADFLRNKKNARRWLIVFACLAVVFSLGTYVALKLTGQAKTRQVLACSYEVHKHTDECYKEIDGEKQLVCGYADYVVHTHNKDCYDEKGELVCKLPEIKEHKHDDSCYGTVRTLTCGQEETSGHTHTDACYSVNRVLTCGQEETPGHTHDASCYDAEGNVICGQEETPGHTHDASCYTEERVLTCGQEETPGHTHSDSCYSEERQLVCGELELHTHTDECYEVQEGVDADNDGEDDKILTCTIPVLEEHTHDESCFKTVEMAEGSSDSQTEAADGQDGQQAEEEEHNFSFICSKEEHTHDDTCYDEEGNLICGKEEHVHGESCAEGEKEPVYVCGKEEHTHDDSCRDKESLELICGKEEHTHDESCLASESDDLVLTAEGEGYVITVTIPKSSIPEHEGQLTLKVRELEADSEEYIASNAVLAEQGVETENQRIFDIALMDGENEIEPIGPVTVSYISADADEEKDGSVVQKVYHIDTDKKEVDDMEATEKEDGSVVMTTPHFSYYAFSTIGVDNVSTWDQLKAKKSGSVKLTGNISATERVTLTGNLTIDLNGYTITNKSNTNGVYYVSSGKTLTITDSSTASTNAKNTVDGAGAKVNFSWPECNDNGTMTFNRKATFDGNKQLTYYKTVASDNDTGTDDTTYKYTVDLSGVGAFTGGKSCVWVNGGTLNIEGGRFTNTAGAAVVMVGGQCNIRGGFLCGSNNMNDNTCNGGGVYGCNGASIDMTGGVIAANQAWSGGGIALENDGTGTMTMSGGVISGNYAKGYGDVDTSHHGLYQEVAYGGGGLWLMQTNFTLSAEAYITNNYTDGSKHGTTASLDQKEIGNNTQGGGGILFSGDNKTFEMTGGYVTGNYAWNMGGGIYHRQWKIPTTDDGVFRSTFKMSGGSISSNYSYFREGGGLIIALNVKGEISPADGQRVNITNNQTQVTRDWGGGGIFVTSRGKLTIHNALIYNNTAHGFGGGLTGCPTGKLYVQPNDGAAIFDNTADGVQITQSGKTDDHEAQNNKTFMANGFGDFYCEDETHVKNKMMGDGYEKWQGTVDGKVVDLGDGEVDLAATDRVGLSARPDQAYKDAAIAAAKVFISGNHSNTHGGGILCNGIIVFGHDDAQKYHLPVELNITKRLVNEQDERQTLTAGQFTFLLYDQNMNKVGTAQNDADGNVKLQIPGGETAATYYLVEKRDAGVTNIVYSNRIYKITFDAPKSEKHNNYTTYWYKSIKEVSYAEPGGDLFNQDGNLIVDGGWSWTNVSSGNNGYKFTAGNVTTNTVEYGSLDLYYKNNSYETFKNTEQNGVSLVLRKYCVDDSGNETGLEGVTFTLTLEGGDPSEQPVEGVSTTDGRVVFTLKTNSTYHMKETPLNGYYSAGPWIIETKTKENETKVYKAVITTNPDGTETWEKGEEIPTENVTFSENGVSTQVSCYSIRNYAHKFGNFQLVKKGRLKEDRELAPLSGAKFTLYDRTEDETLASSQTKWEMETDTDGKAIFEKLPYGHDYLLVETEAPELYILPDYVWFIRIDMEGNCTIYEVTLPEEYKDRPQDYMPQESDLTEGNKVELDKTDDMEAVTWGATFINTPTKDLYELPESGGPGTTIYTMSGLLLLAAFGALMYSKRIRERRSGSSRI